MAINKARLIAGVLGTNSLVSYDSDLIESSYNKGVSDGTTGTMDVYTSIDSLPSSAEAGTKALITSTNSLYIYNNGWYKIAIINNFNPQWVTQPGGSYILALDGSITSITVLATDSDDVPITYTAITDSNFTTFATVTHDSDKHNVWTITPTATSGTYTGTVTFRASDGVNNVQANSTFTLSFITTNSNYTTLLLKADSDGTDNQIDASSNNHTITEVGNVTSTSFAPHHPGGYSVEFNATDASITVPAATSGEYRLGPDTGWTLEFWVNSIDFSQTQIIYVQRNAMAAQGTIANISTSGLITFYQGDFNTDGWEVQISCGTIVIGTWNHVAIVRNGTGSNNYKTYLNGTQQAQATWSGTATNRRVAGYIGGGNSSYNSDNREFVGYMRDFRYTESAVYTSNFTPPTEPLTVLASTKLLYFNGEGFVNDKASVYGAPTVTSNVSTVRDGPYDYGSYAIADHGGSLYFDGTGDYITAPQAVSTSLNYQSYFTIEGWFYATDLSSSGAYGRMIAASGSGTQTSNIRVTSAGKLYFQIYFSSANHTLFETPDANTIKENTWHHIAFVHNYGEYSVPNEYIFYVDGKNVGSTTTAINSYGWYNGSAMGPMYIGKHSYNNTAYWLGYISDFRIVNSLVYDSEFTPPTAPLTAITNTQLLTCTNKNNIWDIASGNLLTKAGDVTASNTQRKFTTSSAMYFDGTGDYLNLPNASQPLSEWVNGDWTVELQIYTTKTANQNIWSFASAPGAANTAFGLWTGYTANKPSIYVSNGSSYFVTNLAGTTTVTDGAWYHIAVTKSGNVYRIFVNGTQEATTTNSGTINTAATNILQIGRQGSGTEDFNGYIQDFRITKGLARYTAAFTAPTAEFTG